MAGIMEEEPDDDKDKGELKYQESKQFNSEWFICSAYDNTTSRRVTFEIYGLDTQDMFLKTWDYAGFDNLFRFNAELMNPNRKEGRFHYIIERLSIVTVNKKRELKLMPEPTDEVPELPVYETNRKIPTGRMDLKERQRLREQMDMLDIRRAENIAKKRQATRQRVLQHIMQLKEEDKRKKAEQDQKIEEERLLRYKLKEEQEKKQREEEARLEQMKKLRRRAVESREESTEERDEEEYRRLRARWRVKDAEKAQILADLQARKAKEREETMQEEQRLKENLEQVAARREAAHEARAIRVHKKEAAKIKAILEVKLERERMAKLGKERNKAYLRTLHAERQPLFKAQLARTQERILAAEAEQEAYVNYKERRALPKKVKTKGTSARSRSKEAPAVAALKPGKKSGRPKSKGGEGTETEGGTDGEKPDHKPPKGAIDSEKILDAVEAKMRKKMAEEREREKKNEQRQAKIEAKKHAWMDKENTHNAQVREEYRQSVTLKQQAEAERRLVMRQAAQEKQEAADRKAAERLRLEKVREQSILKKEMARMAALTA
mmetsp:Transcript_34186/g.72788  ORF Transcript_34186/g.72788 Transcript_34186/m.72788 type:complete len:551 (-) Transcript_34186:260-1912(-)